MNYKNVREPNLSKVPGEPIRLMPIMRRQVQQILAEGPTAVVRKLRILARFIPQLPAAILALPVVLVVRLLRPLVVIRFGPVRAANFGHFAGEPELYLSKREVGLDDSRTFDVHYYSNRHQSLPFCNEQLKTMWDRTLRMNRLARWPDWINRSIPGGSVHIVPPANTRDIHGCLARTETHLRFTDAEEELGRKGLIEMGIPEDAPFVGFHARDSAWLRNLAPDLDFRYHDHRDSNIQDYIPAMQALVDRGYFAIRMGSVVKDALESTNERILDFATNGSRTDFLDIYIGAKCRFFIGSAAGVTEVAKSFRRPVVSVNQIPLGYTHSWGPGDLFIPKKLWLRSEERFLTFREILECSIGANLNGSIYEEMGVDPIDNTPEEIIGAVLEADERVRGTWQPEPGDEGLQHSFWGLFEQMPIHLRGGEPLHGVIASRIGAKFLRDNPGMLN